MGVEWQLLRSGPEAAEHGVLLLPGGACAARSYEPVMAQPALAGTRLVAATLPGHAGTPPPEDFAVEAYAQRAAELASEHGCDVVAGFSMGATVALEMVTSGAFRGPVVLLGISLSTSDEPALFRAVVGLSTVLRGLPVAALMRLTAIATRWARVSDEHRADMRADLVANDAAVLTRGMSAYLDYLGRDAAPAEQLCAAGVPVWVVHTRKGDGGLTDEERRTLEADPQVRVLTLPGNAFFLPDERAGEIAGIVAEAVGSAA